MAALTLQALSKTYRSAVAVVGLDLRLADGELVVMVGPSGGGKTTTLRLIAGLEKLDGGKITIGGRDVTGVPPGERGVSMLFQRPVLYPGVTVRDNLLFYKRLRNSRPAVQRPQLEIAPLAHAFQLDALLDRTPGELSGGQQQRAALARTLIRPAAVYLLDEPLSHLDAPLRLELRRELHLLHRRFPATILIVTHDPLEARALGDRVAVLDAGRVRQIGPPPEVWQRPGDRRVAELLHPLMSFASGRLTRQGGRLTFTSGPGSWPVSETWAPHTGREVILGIDAKSATCAAGGEPMDVALVEAHGSEWLVTCESPLGRIPALSRDGNPPRAGEKMMVKLDWSSILLFDGASGSLLAGRSA